MCDQTMRDFEPLVYMHQVLPMEQIREAYADT